MVVRGLVEAHGGRVWVESEEGRGSCFTFTLPVMMPVGRDALA
jgi:signal transduction histidine kinase